ncbi:MAG: SAM-dependent methyltransferase, partial [Candidatus Marinimicrobia bacterium]|nr:SAM-dependent methyltransferase [Candidatus Neomarinimicrobiota bacterium]
MTPCALCAAPAQTLIDFGPQPICNRFPKARGAAEEYYPLVLGQCGACGLLQLLDPPPPAVLKPRVDW